jgi:hypothetical protein
MPEGKKKSVLRAFWDFFVLFSGISTASNLERTQGAPLRRRGLFLLRKPASKPSEPLPDETASPRNR